MNRYTAFLAKIIKIRMNDFVRIRLVKKGAIARIELNRPDAANGLDFLMSSELRQAAALCNDDTELKAVILSATGRFFCAGGDLKEMLSHGDEVGPAVKKLADNLHATISILSRMPAALIVAVNGVAAGAGFSIAICGDIVLAAESAGFTMAYTKAGLCPDGSSSYLLPRLVGLRKAQQLMLTNPVLSATEACDIGLATEVVADGELRARAEAIAAEFAAGARLSTDCVKKLLLASWGNDIESQMELECELITQCVASPDGREGIRAFVEKRKPDFD